MKNAPKTKKPTAPMTLLDVAPEILREMAVDRYGEEGEEWGCEANTNRWYVTVPVLVAGTTWADAERTVVYMPPFLQQMLEETYRLGVTDTQRATRQALGIDDTLGYRVDRLEKEVNR